MSAADSIEPIHVWFSLSYANYLVVPRSVLQSMPQEWQSRFVAALEEMHETFPDLPWPSYDVRALAREPGMVYEDCGECEGEGVVMDGEVESDCPSCEGTGESGEQRYETPEEVGVVLDPIPHYDRGRTKLERSGAA